MEDLCFSSVDPLGRLSTLHDVFVNNITFNSIELAYWYAMLRLHDLDYEANEMLSIQGLSQNPVGIVPWLKSIRFNPSAKWIFQSNEIMYAILTRFASDDRSFLRKELQSIDCQYPTPCGNQFMLTGASEFVWSSGIRKNEKRVQCQITPPGSNLYGKLVRRLSLAIRANKLNSLFTMEDLLDINRRPILSPKYSKTVLLLTDSQGRQVQSIQSGFVVRKGGGRYDDVANELWKYLDAESLQITDFAYIIVLCGVNLCARHQRDVQWWARNFEQLHSVLVPAMGLSSSTKILLNTPICTPVKPLHQEHTQWLRSYIKSPSFHNTFLYDWSSPENNPFYKDGALNPHLTYPDRLHINFRGFRQMWLQWCRSFPELESVAYTMGPAFYSEETHPPENRKLFSTNSSKARKQSN